MPKCFPGFITSWLPNKLPLFLDPLGRSGKLYVSWSLLDGKSEQYPNRSHERSRLICICQETRRELVALIHDQKIEIRSVPFV